MTEEIRLPRIEWDKIIGKALVIPVKVAWPELQLTLEQVSANALARAFGRPAPYWDRSIFHVVIPRPFPCDKHLAAELAARENIDNSKRNVRKQVSKT